MSLHTLTRGMLAMMLAALVVAASSSTFGGTVGKPKKEGGDQKEEKKGETIQRVPTNAYEVLKNKISKIEFYSSNYGIFGLDVQHGVAGTNWPRGSNKPYVFGGGVWFGCEKNRNGQLQKLSVIGYNPNSGASWLVPGAIDGPLEKSGIDQSPTGVNKYRLYFSSDYDKFSGQPLDKKDVNGPYWPLWDTNPNDTLKFSRYFGYYIDDINLRNRTQFPKGPAVISGEDIFSIYKDTDLSKYEKISRDTAKKKGYPIGLQIEQTIYTWGFGQYGDFLFIKYSIINKSPDTLFNCFQAPTMDMDIGRNAANDHSTIALPNKDQDTLNLAIQWSDQESSGQFGYAAFDFLESPTVDKFGFVRKDRRVFADSEQIGLTVFQSWPIEEDPQTAEQRYDFMSDITQRDVDAGPGDRRFLMATGPFNMLPGDTARVVVGIAFAYGLGTIPTGQEADRRNIYAIDRFMQKIYNENFRAPEPPAPATVSWRGVNNGVELHWDDRSERSLDQQERGLDFAGYTIKRGRRTIGFPEADSTDGWNLGFKTVGGFVLPPLPDTLTRIIAAQRKDLSVLGAWWRLPMLGALLSDTVTSTTKWATDTVKRPGLPDSVFISKKDSLGTYYHAKLVFDPYADNNDDSTAFNDGRYGDQFKNKATRDIVRDAIVAIMDSVTNGRKFVDVGDDNADGRIITDESDLKQNERLINNVDYYYQVLAYDAGSVEEGTPSKINVGIAGINEVRATPEAAPAGANVTPKIISQDGLGGIHNFRFNVLDNQRLSQLFGGKQLEFTFNPVRPTSFLSEADQKAGLFLPQYFYVDGVTVNVIDPDSTSKVGSPLARWAMFYGGFTDRSDTALRLLDSGLTTRKVDSGTYIARNVSSTYNLSYDADPLRPVYNTVGVYQNTFSIGFDYTFIQFGDSLRPGVFGDATLKAKPFAITNGGANTNLAPGKAIVGLNANGGTKVNQTVDLQGMPSIGQPKLEIEFTPGGTDHITFNKGGTDYAVDVPYLNMNVRNVASFDRDEIDASGNTTKKTVQYNFQFQPDPYAALKSDTTNVSIDLPRVITRGTYGLYAFGWINADTSSLATRKNPFQRGKQLVGTPGYKQHLGVPGHYYLGQTKLDANNTLRFTHSLIVNGSEIFIDFAGMSSPDNKVNLAYMPDPIPSTDFKAGDKFTVSFTGGTLGLPQPGAKVVVSIPKSTPNVSQYTDDELDQISIVPNPFLINHIGQSTNTDRRMYFTHLPTQCKVELYTEAGELLQTINHDASLNQEEGGRVSVAVWDLLTKANRQAQSQLIIVRITTPNGAETIKKVAIVVGGFLINNG